MEVEPSAFTFRASMIRRRLKGFTPDTDISRRLAPFSKRHRMSATNKTRQLLALATRASRYHKEENGKITVVPVALGKKQNNGDFFFLPKNPKLVTVDIKSERQTRL